MIPNLNTENANFHVINTKYFFTLPEKCPNTEFFVVRIQENTDEKNSVLDTLQAVLIRTKTVGLDQI